MIRWAFYFIGLLLFSLGLTITIQMQYLGVHPWDVLHIGLYNKLGFSIGSWNIICSILLIIIAFILDKSYIKIGTFLNAFLVGILIDSYLWLDFLPRPGIFWIDISIMMIGIVLMGIGGGVYNAGMVGAGPRDGFMLSISDKTGISIGKVRIVVESLVLVLGLLLGGPVFIFTFLITFIQSPLFQLTYLKCKQLVEYLTKDSSHRKQVI
ncbi:hypothetical protein DX933_10080 [Ornithinibacillus gellani]|uniref:YczE/YyaS/YitT family protein n=1 Tax=Ornithinibacillus gellani TaxID=2293253 RepID=UPI000F49EA7C|nr:hypothetical protein [Ornithinibacillus gellani]TQS74733.1 hypothetical protein DX933_10080 [Ornithinibacillus gellani]